MYSTPLPLYRPVGPLKVGVVWGSGAAICIPRFLASFRSIGHGLLASVLIWRRLEGRRVGSRILRSRDFGRSGPKAVDGNNYSCYLQNFGSNSIVGET